MQYLSALPRFERFSADAIRHTEGDFAGDVAVWEEWQRDILRELFLVNPETGRRVYRSAFIGVPTKNGKSTLAGSLSLFGLTADVMPDGRLEQRPQVISAAASKDQTAPVFKGAAAMVAASPVLDGRVQVFDEHMWNPVNDGTFRAIASMASTTHGVNPTWTIVDELHAHPNGKLLTTLAKSVVARSQPMQVVITHTGWDRHGVLGKAYDRALNHPLLEVYGGQSGKPGEPMLMVIKDRKNGFLFWWYGPRESEQVDFEDPAVWMACNPASWVTTEVLMAQAARFDLDWEDFCRFHLNAWVLSTNALLGAGVWAGLADPELVIPRGSDMWLGVDAANKHDTAAIVGDAPIDLPGERQLHRYEAYIMERPDNPDELLERTEMKLRWIAKRYRVREVAYDPMFFERSAQILRGEGLNMVQFPQSDVRMAAATRALKTAAMSGLCVHDGDPTFAAHIGRAATKDTKYGIRLAKENATDHMDASVACAMATLRASVDDTKTINEEGPNFIVIE